MHYRRLASFAILAGAITLGGCYESADVTVHEPGEYKGGVDPLLADAASREEDLQKRFDLVQRDR